MSRISRLKDIPLVGNYYLDIVNRLSIHYDSNMSVYVPEKHDILYKERILELELKIEKNIHTGNMLVWFRSDSYNVRIGKFHNSKNYTIADWNGKPIPPNI